MPYDNQNSGILYRNDRKQQSSHPDFTGSCDIVGADGVTIPMWISAWTKEGKPGSKFEGKRFFSLSFKPKEAKTAAPRPQAEANDDMAPTPVQGNAPQPNVPRGTIPPPAQKSQVERELDGDPDAVPF
jgi:hypothetical protein